MMIVNSTILIVVTARIIVIRKTLVYKPNSDSHRNSSRNSNSNGNGNDNSSSKRNPES